MVNTVTMLSNRNILYYTPRPSSHALTALCVGLIIGFCFSGLFVMLTPPKTPWMSHPKPLLPSRPPTFINTTTRPTPTPTPATSTNHIDDSVAQWMFNEVRVLCWVMTNPSNHKTKAAAVNATWGPRCNKLLFISSAADDELPTVALPVGEGRQNLWAKTKEAHKYIYANHYDEAEWFFKADDDTYAVVENLRYVLYPHSPQTPIYFGCRFKKFVTQGYMSGGAGYVLSKEALRRFVVDALPNGSICKQNNTGSEDVEIGKCLANVNVRAGDSRDELGRGRFFPFGPEKHITPTMVKSDNWYWSYIYYKIAGGLDCCSDTAVAYHYIKPEQMYMMEYLIYRLHPYGIVNRPQPLLTKLEVNQTPRPPPEPENFYNASATKQEDKKKTRDKKVL